MQNFGSYSKYKHYWFVLFLFTLWGIFCIPYIKGSIPFPSDYLVSFFPPWNSQYGMPVKNNAMPDVITQIFPWKKLTIDTWKSGHVPLWNPYSFSGTPHAGNYQSAVFSPVNILFFIFPFLTAWSLMILFQPLVAGIGSYFLLVRLGRSSFSALLASVAFMFCGFMTTWMAYGTLGWAAAMLPWVLLAVLNKSSSVAFFIAFSFVSGHFQTSLYVLLASILFLFFQRKFPTILYILLGICLVAPQLFLSYHAYVGSTRETQIGQIEVIPWSYFITAIIPDFFGNPVTRNDWFGHYAEWASFIGVIPLLFALLSLQFRQKDGRLYFIVLAMLSLAFSYQTPLNALLYRFHIPVLSTSASSRLIVCFSFAMAMLSAWGFEDIQRYWKSKHIRPVLRFNFTLIACMSILWIFLFRFTGFSPDRLTVAIRNSILPTVFSGIFIAISLLGFLRKEYVQRVLIILCIGISSFDSYRYVSKWMPVGDPRLVYPEVASAKYLVNYIGNNRVFGNIGNEFSGIFKLPVIDGYDALYQARYAQFLNAAATGQATAGGRSVVQFDKHAKYRTEILKLLGIKYIYHRASDGRNSWTFPYWEYAEKGQMKIVFNDERYQIYEYPEAYPRVYLASSYKRTTDDWDKIQTLFGGSFDSRQSLILEEQPSLEPSEGDGSVEVVQYEPNEIVLKTDSKVDKLLFLSDVYDSGWKAKVDNVSTYVHRANYDFRAIAVSAGTHTIHFYYDPPELWYGCIVASIAAILIGGVFIRKKLYARRNF